MLKLYYAPDTCALATHIALEQVGAEYETVRVNFAEKEENSPEYLRMNPKGRVPTLVTSRGILTETPAILQFVCQTYPDAGLAPLDDIFELARMNAFNSYLCSTVHVAHAHRLRGNRWADDPLAIAAMQKKVPQSVGDSFALIEREFHGPWVLGERYSTCDIYLFTLAQWLESDGVNPEQFPRIADHRTRMRQDPLVAKIVAAETSGG
ncbi:MAG: glutathione S-transferase family protein [Gammaproteobacteria bacterium]|jgi:glutathione S-transferase|nr:glutathione S-transferase family protein [Gammaproteobacteria bacterium]